MGALSYRFAILNPTIVNRSCLFLFFFRYQAGCRHRRPCNSNPPVNLLFLETMSCSSFRLLFSCPGFEDISVSVDHDPFFLGFFPSTPYFLNSPSDTRGPEMSCLFRICCKISLWIPAFLNISSCLEYHNEFTLMAFAARIFLQFSVPLLAFLVL